MKIFNQQGQYVNTQYNVSGDINLSVEENRQKLEYIYKAAEGGSMDAQFSLGVIYFYGQLGTNKNPVQAEHWFIKAANNGHANAKFNLGLMYFHGIGIPANSKKSAYWFEESAKQGNSNAQFMLSGIYLFGIGVEENPSIALHWLEQADKNGHTKAKIMKKMIYQRLQYMRYMGNIQYKKNSMFSSILNFFKS